jgi:hypothetical protein
MQLTDPHGWLAELRALKSVLQTSSPKLCTDVPEDIGREVFRFPFSKFFAALFIYRLLLIFIV